ncbi:MAG TPA: DUF5985 family protein [Pseudolabrys sp.]|jgi:hypothetical protein|nr:DUF5985 family protein [Pseudolabrys sp.]
MSNTIAAAVYLLCFATSIVCGWLLVRSYLRTRTALPLWTAACFVLLAVANLLLLLDFILPPDVDLRLPRVLAGLAAVSTLLYGFVWEVD